MSAPLKLKPTCFAVLFIVLHPSIDSMSHFPAAILGKPLCWLWCFICWLLFALIGLHIPPACWILLFLPGLGAKSWMLGHKSRQQLIESTAGRNAKWSKFVSWVHAQSLFQVMITCKALTSHMRALLVYEPWLWETKKNHGHWLRAPDSSMYLADPWPLVTDN